MPLVETGRAIGSVSELLREYLGTQTGLNITVGPPRPGPGPGTGDAVPTLNLFLYEALFDPSLRNTPLDEGQSPPLWLVLKYLLTAFDVGGNSDSVDAHEDIGRGLRALQELNLLFLNGIPPLPSTITRALADNPEVMKITFDQTTSDLISRLVAGSGAEDRYRFSVGFEVRPVMIATAEPPSYSLLVGVDHTQAPPVNRDDGGVNIPVIPSLGPTISSVEPPVVPQSGTFTVAGNDLSLSNLVVTLGPVELPVVAQPGGELVARADVAGLPISAGTHPLAVAIQLPGGSRRSSNLLFAGLRPTITGAVAAPSPDPDIQAVVTLTGHLLGRAGDEVFVALHSEGEIVGIYDQQDDSPAPPLRSRLHFPPPPGDADQSTLTLELRNADAAAPGIYRVILRVNGQQAAESPTVDLAI